jgi:hypothetical protein
MRKPVLAVEILALFYQIASAAAAAFVLAAVVSAIRVDLLS